MTATATWPAWSTTVCLVVERDGDLATARRAVEAEIDAMDRAASRFRADSELSSVNGAGGRPHRVSPLLHEAVAVALWAAEISGGLVDPTLGRHLAGAGYDRDIAQVGAAEHPGPFPAAAPAGTWRDVELHEGHVAVPRGTALDLGATAKALTADRALAAANEATGAGVLLSLGGDVAMTAAPAGWRVLVTERPDDEAGAFVTAYGGGLATSTTLHRRWRLAGHDMHHLLDPRTGLPIRGPWRTATVAAASCVEANIASTAALVMGDRAVSWLANQALPARLVGGDGRVRVLGAWPEEAAA